ncbi:hypothetical protein KEJ47_09580 [Candidatus Bathyarchaeota archaeon]|nr:hypothetical protein [Candidatus Bathyarchaeota archaeon]
MFKRILEKYGVFKQDHSCFLGRGFKRGTLRDDFNSFKSHGYGFCGGGRNRTQSRRKLRLDGLIEGGY